MFPRDQDAQREAQYNATLRTNQLLEQLISLLTPKITGIKNVEAPKPGRPGRKTS